MSEGGHLLHHRIIALTGDAVQSKKRLFECAAGAVSVAFELDSEAVYKALLGERSWAVPRSVKALPFHTVVYRLRRSAGA